MLTGRLTPRGNAIHAQAGSMAPEPGEGRDIKVRQASTYFDGADAALDREAQAKELNYQSWDLGILQLERISLFRRPGRTHHRGNLRADDWPRGRDIGSAASAYLQQGSPPDLNFRILIATLDEGASEQLLTAFLPCTLLRKSVPSQSAEHMVALDSWQGAIIAGHLLSLARELPSIPKEHWPMLGAAASTLVQACLVPTRGNPARTGAPKDTAVRERLRCVVRQNMKSPDFGPEALRRLVGMSRSKLYRIFGGTGGVARCIQDERLDVARQRLADIGDTTPIRTLASEVGFIEHSSFSRAFKLRYGTSPTEFRETVLAQPRFDARDDRHDADSMTGSCNRSA